MASGCTTTNSSSTPFGNKTPDGLVKYTGPDIPALGICTGDTLKEIEAIILGKIIDFSTGTGIFISDIDLTACTLFVNHITCCNGPGTVPKELKELIQIIFDVLCALDTRLTTVEDFIDDLISGPYSTACLTGLPANPTLKQILQQLLIEFCALKAQVTALQTQVNNLTTSLPTTIGNFLLGHVNSCQGTGGIVKTGTGATANIQILGICPIGTVTPFDGDMSWFDSTGLGYTNTPACGWALCNGDNGTRNMNGVSVIGTTTMGGSVNPAADGGTYSLGATGGKVSVLLAPNECAMPSHTHGVNEPNGGQGHSHKFKFGADNGPNPGSIPNYQKWDGDNLIANLDGTPPNDGNTGGGVGNVRTRVLFNTTGITISATPSVAAQVAHENRMPYVALPWIKRIA